MLFKDAAVAVATFIRHYFNVNSDPRTLTPSEVDKPSISDTLKVPLSNEDQTNVILPASSVESVERSLTGYISRVIWAEHGRGAVDVDVAGNVLMNAPLREGISREELVGLAAELEYDDCHKTTMSPVDHVRKWLPFILSLRTMPFYSTFDRRLSAQLIQRENVDLNIYGFSPTHLQSPRTRLNRSSSGFADGKRTIRRVDTTSKTQLASDAPRIPDMTVSEKILFLSAQSRRGKFNCKLE